MNYILHILILINIYVILCVATNLLVGMTNLLSMGQAAFYGIGAYLYTLILMKFSLPFIPTLFIAITGTALIGWLVGYTSLRLNGDYFILATMGFQILVFSILNNWIPVTKGPFGIPGIPSPKLFGIIELTGTFTYFVVSTIFAIMVCVLGYRLIKSPFGRMLRCIKDDEIPIKTVKRNPNSFKIEAFVISSGIIAIAGAIYASYISYIDPTSFNLDQSIFIITALIIGGTGNIKGSVVGAVFVILLPELLRFVNIPDSIAANTRMIIYGFCLILFMIYRPQGIVGVKLR